MKLAFFLFHYFPYGGLQRDCLKIALECVTKGHSVTIYTQTWQGEQPVGIRVVLLKCRALTNIAKDRAFIKQVSLFIQDKKYDALVGFNRIPGLDIYYGADPCYVIKSRRLKPFWHRWTLRYRHFSGLEKSVFDPSSKTQILLLTLDEIPHYQALYGTQMDRFHLLPPVIMRRHYSKEVKANAREKIRALYHWSEGDNLLLFVGSGFRIKGLDRSIKGLASLPDTLRRKTYLLVIGQDKSRRYRWLAQRLGIKNNVFFLRGRSDVYTFMLACDLLIHPAHSESAGLILLEALTAGLTVLTTDSCGYAFHIQQAKAGYVLPTPFLQVNFNRQLVMMLTSAEQSAWSKNGLAYAQKEDLYSGHQKAVQMIETFVAKKSSQ